MPRVTDRHVVSVLSFILCGSVLVGCRGGAFGDLFTRSPHQPVAPNSKGESRDSRQTSGSIGGSNRQIVALRFDVIRIDLPLNEMQHSRKVWNHVDELRVDPAKSALLLRNGFRMGAASGDAWPAIKAVAELAGAEVRRETLSPQRGAPLVIELGEVREGQSIFTYNPQGGLEGNTYAGGKKLVVIDYDYHPRMGGMCELLVGFEIRRPLGEMTWETHNGVIRQVPAMDRKVFTELRSGLTLHPGELLLLGLGDRSQTAYIMGSRFLTVQRGDQMFETLLCLKPIPVELNNGKS